MAAEAAAHPERAGVGHTEHGARNLIVERQMKRRAARPAGRQGETKKGADKRNGIGLML